tara:strand:+ start:1205 stop:1996 length:792 start_codon:yes stop_codon:yes gene_type:complete
MLKILFLGDIVGRPGRHGVAHFLKESLDTDTALVIANAENSAGGNGLTSKISLELKKSGCDLLTLGDHVWDQKNFQNEISTLENVCRPYNLPLENPGKKYLLHKIPQTDKTIAVATFLGRSFMKIQSDCPFKKFDLFYQEVVETADFLFVEMHAETTAEKIAFGWHVNGRASAVVGTHTHVQTADGEILDQGTAYLTDVGMCGPHRSVLGREVDPIIQRFQDGLPRKCPVADKDVRVSGCYIELDSMQKIALNIKPFQQKIDL